MAVTLASAAWKHDVKNPTLPRDVTPGKATDVKLVPYGCSRMRVSMFPVALDWASAPNTRQECPRE